MPFTHSCVPMGFSSQGGLDITRAPNVQIQLAHPCPKCRTKKNSSTNATTAASPVAGRSALTIQIFRIGCTNHSNIYGLATVSSKMPTCLPCSSDFPSHRYTHMPFLPVGPKEVPSLRAPRQHALVASATEVTALISSEGYWNTLTIPLNHETGKFEIISIDAFERTIDRGLNTVTNFIIAVAAFQTGGSKSNIELNETDDYCLRIYGASTAPSVYLEETLFNIGGSFQVIKLKAAPMHLSHINITQNGRCQTAIILSATDGIVHVYLEVGNRTCRGLGLRVESFARLDHRSHSWCLLQEPVTAEFLEVDVEEYFSILGRMSTARLNSLIPYVIINRGSVLSLDIFDEEDTRVVVAGSQSGELHMAVYQIDKMVNGLSGWSSAFTVFLVYVVPPISISTTKQVEESSHSTKLFTPITSVKIFRAVQRKATSAPPTVATTSSTTVRVAQPTTPLNLLITCAIEQASVYQ
ncbi:hypothetical protein BC938DRAFT_474615 [Jimgerdemannia flammicorona]|uniref:Uncharacterized protein n=1 Tax=Jimgerdemannia flammicorona TaxID=994334 RepID=A0A433QSE7_9FUNG|nr:hypothetical protein BC938DRAFT_474615 [Jimgerdemannia flammicorona]